VLVSVDQPTTGKTKPNIEFTGDQIVVDIPQDTTFISATTDQPYL
jgi:hypothetical protein